MLIQAPTIDDYAELAALEWLGKVGYSYLCGPEIAPGGIFWRGSDQQGDD
jgi:hypothetical protein